MSDHSDCSNVKIVSDGVASGRPVRIRSKGFIILTGVIRDIQDDNVIVETGDGRLETYNLAGRWGDGTPYYQLEFTDK